MNNYIQVFEAGLVKSYIQLDTVRETYYLYRSLVRLYQGDGYSTVVVFIRN